MRKEAPDVALRLWLFVKRLGDPRKRREGTTRLPERAHATMVASVSARSESE